MMTSYSNPASIALTINSIFCFALALAVWMRRVKPGGISFGLLMFSLAIWSMAAGLENGAVGMDEKIIFSKISYFGIATVPLFFLIFVVEYSRFSQWLSKRNLSLLSIIPILSIIMVFTNDFHHLLWDHIEPSFADANILVYHHGPYFWVHAIYAYICMIIGMIVIIQTAISFTRRYRVQALSLFLAAVIPLLANFVYVMGLSPIPGLDITPFGFSITAVVLAWSIYRHQLFGIIPIARDLMIEYMSDGVVVLDHLNHILDVNPAAARMVNCDRKKLLGKHIGEVLADQAHIIEKLRSMEEGYEEVTVTSTPPMILEVRVTSLKDRQGNSTARLFLLHDVTVRKMIEESERKQRQLAEAVSDSTAALSSILELDVVLDRILVDVKKVVGHDTANIALLDEKGKIRFVRSMGYEEKGWENPTKDLVLDIQEYPNFLKMKKKKQPIFLADTLNDASWQQTSPSLWIRSYVGAPICLGKEVVGFINLDSATSNFFTQETAHHLMLFANQVAVAIQNARLFEQLEEMAIRDWLTGSYNTRFFYEMGAKEVAKAIRYKKPLSLIMIDLDDYKMVNDRHGHLVGDQLLQKLVKNCLKVMRETDIFSRYGGEEFVVLLPETDDQAALLVAERLRKVIESSTITTSDEVVKVTASLGVVALADGQVKLQELINCADQALYAAKEAGRNQAILFPKSIHARKKK